MFEVMDSVLAANVFLCVTCFFIFLVLLRIVYVLDKVAMKKFFKVVWIASASIIGVGVILFIKAVSHK